MPLLSRYLAHLHASGSAPGTVRMRIHHATEIAALTSHPRQLATAHLERWLQPAGRAYSPETLKSRRASARRYVGWMHEEGVIPTNPAARLRPIRVIPAPPRVIPDHAMIGALAHATARDRAALLLARYGCLRLTEIATLRPADRERDALRVHGKGGRVRIVYMHDELRRALDVIQDEAEAAGWYFPGTGASGHMHPQALHKAIKRVCGWNPHALRHAGASAAYRATKDLRAVQLMLGHASLTTTQRYLSLDQDALRALAAGVGLTAA